jgi:hypothetical protein
MSLDLLEEPAARACTRPQPNHGRFAAGAAATSHPGAGVGL